MADVELVIKIPEGLKKDFESEQWTALSCMEMKNALMNGIPLPKGHGKLIDADEVVKEICIEYKANSIYELSDELRSFIKKYLNEAPTMLKPTTEYMIKNYAFSKSEG